MRAWAQEVTSRVGHKVPSAYDDVLEVGSGMADWGTWGSEFYKACRRGDLNHVLLSCLGAY